MPEPVAPVDAAPTVPAVPPSVPVTPGTPPSLDAPTGGTAVDRLVAKLAQSAEKVPIPGMPAAATVAPNEPSTDDLTPPVPLVDETELAPAAAQVSADAATVAVEDPATPGDDADAVDGATTAAAETPAEPTDGEGDDWKPSWEKAQEEADKTVADAASSTSPDTVEEIAAKQAFLDELAKGAGENGANAEDLFALMTKLPRGQRVYAAFKDLRELEKPTEEGGLGHRPDAAQIIEAFRGNYAFNDLREDLNSGDSERSRTALGYLFGANSEGKVNEGAMKAVLSLPHLLVSNPATVPVFRQLESILLTNRVEQTYRLAEAETNPVEKKALGMAATHMDWLLRGEWRPIPGLQLAGSAGETPIGTSSNGTAAGANGALPDDVRRRLSDQQAQIDGYRSGEDEAFVDELQSATSGALTGGVSEALTDLSGRYDEILFQGVESQFVNEVERRLEGNVHLTRQIRTLTARALDTRDESDQAALVNTYRQAAAAAIKSLRPRFRRALLSNTPTGKDKQPVNRHAKLSEAQARLEPAASGGGAPVAPAATEKLQRLKGEDSVDFMTRRIQQRAEQRLAAGVV